LLAKKVEAEVPLNHKTTNLLEQLMSPKEQLDNTPYALIKKKKKKKRKGTSD
jgi:hypothetical protein